MDSNDIAGLIATLKAHLSSGSIDLNWLRSQLSSGNLDSLLSVLSPEQRTALQSAVTSGDLDSIKNILSPVLENFDPTAVADTAKVAAASAGTAAAAAAGAAKVASSDSSSKKGFPWWGWAIPLALIAGLAGWWITSHNNSNSNNDAAGGATKGGTIYYLTNAEQFDRSIPSAFTPVKISPSSAARFTAR
jgi:hypothetical protein